VSTLYLQSEGVFRFLLPGKLGLGQDLIAIQGLDQSHLTPFDQQKGVVATHALYSCAYARGHRQRGPYRGADLLVAPPMGTLNDQSP